MLEINNTRCSDILWIVNCWASLFSVVVHSSSEVLRARFTIILKTTSCRTWWWWSIFNFTFCLVVLLYLFTSKHIMRLGDKWGCLRGTSLDNNRLEDVSKDENGNWIERETIGYCLSKSVEWEAWNSRDNCHRYRGCSHPASHYVPEDSARGPTTTKFKFQRNRSANENRKTCIAIHQIWDATIRRWKRWLRNKRLFIESSSRRQYAFVLLCLLPPPPTNKQTCFHGQLSLKQKLWAQEVSFHSSWRRYRVLAFDVNESTFQSISFARCKDGWCWRRERRTREWSF